MQIFLPFPDLVKSLKALDNVRLGKQRVEAFQLFLAYHKKYVLKQEKVAWTEHIVFRMLFSDNYCYLDFLKHYIVLCCREYGSRKSEKTGKYFQNTKMDENIKTYNLQLTAQQIENLQYPFWFGNQSFHDSHKAMLFHKGKENVKDGLFKFNPYESIGFQNFAHINQYVWPIVLKDQKNITITSKNPILKRKFVNKEDNNPSKLKKFKN